MSPQMTQRNLRAEVEETKWTYKKHEEIYQSILPKYSNNLDGEKILEDGINSKYLVNSKNKRDMENYI